MQPFTRLSSRFIPLAHEDVDTDQIIPARYLKVTDKSGLRDGLFYAWRYLPGGEPNPEFPLNWPVYQGAQILIAGDNFGCGSSREHAPWALAEWGLRAILSTSFADIFRSNAMKNGLLPISLAAGTMRRLFALAQADPTQEITVDLAAQTVALPDGEQAHFDIQPFQKLCLLEGVDQLGYLQKFNGAIAQYEAQHAKG
ncbi:MAG: 3-isopropylmalate dehydratase small subunit [Chloroflexi bacterium]|nr:3-isopropylmalate dehydratase small subunit [Chloroflexota bacterium]